MAVEIDTSAFTEEAYELLSELEDSLLELELPVHANWSTIKQQGRA